MALAAGPVGGIGGEACHRQGQRLTRDLYAQAGDDIKQRANDAISDRLGGARAMNPR